MGRNSDSETEPPRPSRSRLRKGEVPVNPVYRNVDDRFLRFSAKSAGKGQHPMGKRDSAQRFRDTAYETQGMPDGLQRAPAPHPTETRRARLSAACKHRVTRDSLSYTSEEEDSSLSRKHKPPKRGSGPKRRSPSASGSSGPRFSSGQRKPKRPHHTAAQQHACARPPDPKPAPTPLVTRPTLKGPRRFPATRANSLPSYTGSSSPRCRSSCSEYSLSELDSDASNNARRRRPRGTRQDTPKRHNGSSPDTRRNRFTPDHSSNSTSETYSSDDDSSDTDLFADKNEHHRGLVKPEPMMKQSSDSFTDSYEDLSTSSVSSGDDQNVARQLHRRRCKEKGRPHVPADGARRLRSETAGQRSPIPPFGSRARPAPLHDSSSDSETDSQSITYGSDSDGAHHGVSQRVSGKQRVKGPWARGCDGPSQLHLVGRKTRKVLQKTQLYTVLSSGSEDESVSHADSSGTLSSESRSTRTRGPRERFASSQRAAQTGLNETTPFHLLQQMEKLTLHESPEPIVTQAPLPPQEQRPPSKAVLYPKVSFSVTYKAPLNAKYVLYVCGTVVELGSSLIPSQVGYRGIPLEEDPDGLGCTDFWRSDPVEIRSVPSGTDIYYTYYVMDDAKVNSTRRKDRYQVAYQERLVPGTTKKMPNSLPLDTTGARCLRLPKVLNHLERSSNTQVNNGPYYRMADYRFGDISRKGRFTLEDAVEHRPDSSDSGSESPDF